MLSLSPVARMWSLLTTVGVLIFLLNIDYTAVNLTLVPIASETKSDLNTLQWLLSAYVLTWAALVVPGGRFADLKGKVKTLNFGIIIFMLGSALTGIGHTAWALIAGRILQGLGAALFSAPAYGLIFSSTPPEKQGLAMGFIGALAGLGLAAGPTLAGWIIDSIGWRWIFYINIPLGLMIIAILLLYGSKDVLAEVRQKIDMVGTLLLASGLCVTVYAINQVEVWGIQSSSLWGLFALGVFLIGLYVLRDRKQTFHMVPPHFLRNKGFIAAALGIFFIAMSFSMVLVLMGLYLQNTLHYSSYETGLIFISMTISMGLLSPIGGKIIDIFGVKEPMIFGALCTGLGMGLMAFLGTSPSLYYIILSLFLVGTGLGAYFTASNIAMMRAVPQSDLSVASGVYTMFMMLGNTLSIVLSTSFVVLFGRIHLLESSLKSGMSLSPGQHQDLVEIISKVEHSVTQLKDFPSEQIPQLLTLIDGAFVYGLSLDMLGGVCFTVIAAGLTLWGVKSTGEPITNQHAPVAL